MGVTERPLVSLRSRDELAVTQRAESDMQATLATMRPVEDLYKGTAVIAERTEETGRMSFYKNPPIYRDSSTLHS